MCYNLSLNRKREELFKRFGVDPGDSPQPGFLLPGFEHPVIPVLAGGSGGLRFIQASWGLIPDWADVSSAQEFRKKTLNARCFEIWDKPSYRKSAVKTRVLIPFDGFFEWQTGPGGKKIPWYFGFKDPQHIGALAGLWSRWNGPDGPADTFSLLTGDPNGLVGHIHNRSPVRLEEKNWEIYLDPDSPRTLVQGLFKPWDWPDMAGYPLGDLLSQKGRNRNVPEIRLPGPVDLQGELF